MNNESIYVWIWLSFKVNVNKLVRRADLIIIIPTENSVWLFSRMCVASPLEENITKRSAFIFYETHFRTI